MNNLEKLRQIEKWVLSEEEVKRRLSLIKDCTSNITNKYTTFFSHPAIDASYQILLLMAHMKPITDDMLLNFFDGLFQIIGYVRTKDEKIAEEINRLTSPALRHLQEYLKSDLWLDEIIDKEATGLEVFSTDGMTIPFTHKEIKQHVLRMKKILLPGGVVNVKADLKRFYKGLYADDVSKPNCRFIIKVDADLKRVHDLYNEDVFECDYETFRSCVETADFRGIKILRQNLAQDLVYRLSGMMGLKWYSEITKNTKWAKQKCSGHGSKLEHDPLIERIDKFLKRPKKRK